MCVARKRGRMRSGPYKSAAYGPAGYVSNSKVSSGPKTFSFSQRRVSGPDFGALPFTPLYLTDDEFAAEIANRTMHGVMHLGWVRHRTGGFHGQMTFSFSQRRVSGPDFGL